MIQVGDGLLYPALRKAGVTLGPGRMPSVAQMDDAFGELTRLLGSLNCDPYFIYSLEVQTFPLTAGQGSYTIGQDATGTVTADFDVPRPQWISLANLVNGTLRTPIANVTAQQWVGSDQSLQGIPEFLYDDRASPISTLYLSPAPSSSLTLEMYVWRLVDSITSANDLVQIPPGYDDAIVLNLAVRLAPHFQKPVDPNVRADARESLMRVLSLNAPRPIAEVGGLGGCGCGFDIYTG